MNTTTENTYYKKCKGKATVLISFPPCRLPKVRSKICIISKEEDWIYNNNYNIPT